VGALAGAFFMPTYVGAQTITVTSYPTELEAGGKVTISWTIQGLTGRLTHNHVHWGPSPATVDKYSTPHLLRGTSFSAVFTAPSAGGKIYFRVHAIVDGKNIYSSILAIEVAAPVIDFRPQVQTPTISPTGGPFTTRTIQVQLSCATSDASIFYTTDGTIPTESSHLYSLPFLLGISSGTSVTVKARAFKVGMKPSEVATATYTYSPEDKYEQDDNWQSPSIPKFFPKADTFLNGSTYSIQPEYRIQRRSIYPGNDPDWIKFTLSKTCRFVAVLTSLDPSVHLPETKDVVVHMKKKIKQDGREVWVDEIKKPSNKTNPVEDRYHRPILEWFLVTEDLGPIGQLRSDLQRICYYFQLNNSNPIEEYLVSMAAFPKSPENDPYEIYDGPTPHGWLQIGDGTNLVQIRQLYLSGGREDTDWAWFRITKRTKITLTCVAIPGNKGQMTIQILGPNNMNQKFQDTLSIKTDDPAELTKERSIDDPGIYYIKITGPQTTIYILKVEMDRPEP